MLSRRSSDSRTAFHNTLNLTVAFVNAVLLIILLHISKRRLCRQRTDRSGTERLPRAEDNLCVLMRLS